MCYGIYDKQEQKIVERNLPQETAYCMIKDLTLGSSDEDGRFCIVKQIDEGFLCIDTMRLVMEKTHGL